MRKISLRAALIAAVIMIAAMAAAVAAGRLLGWSDYFDEQYGTYVPDTAQRVMQEEWNKHSFTLGPVSFTTQELLCDGHIAMASTHISVNGESDALLCAEPYDAIGATGENGRLMAQRLGVSADTTWIEAARQLNRKLYIVRAILEGPAEIDGGCAMEDVLWNEDGSIVYLSMPELNGKAQGKTIGMQLYMRVVEFDVNSETESEVFTNRETLKVFLEAPLEEYNYEVNGAFVAGGLLLKGVKAELTGTGLYLYTTFEALENITADDVFSRELPRWLDEEGSDIPSGISLSTGIDVESLPTVVYTQMLSLDRIPDRMILRVWDEALATEDTINPGYQEMFMVK
ncbi:MAG: hypothetical protein IKJ26_08805 [Clostridia bacterium]|nr:hypothetical protein [Clostridia bacterium]